MKFQDKYPVRIRRFNDMLRADLRFLEQGVSISNEVKSILIGYNELKEMAKETGIKGYTKMNKEELEEAIENYNNNEENSTEK